MGIRDKPMRELEVKPIKRISMGILENKIVAMWLIFLVIFFIGVVVLENTFNVASGEELEEISTSDSILLQNSTTQTLSQTPSGSVTIITKNRTWVSLDGSDDFLNITDDNYETVSFWYKNSTTTIWQNIINDSGTTYVNGSVATPQLYPVFENGFSYLFGQTDATTFVEVDIDEIRFYNGSINSTIATEIYNEGR